MAIAIGWQQKGRDPEGPGDAVEGFVAAARDHQDQKAEADRDRRREPADLGPHDRSSYPVATDQAERGDEGGGGVGEDREREEGVRVGRHPVQSERVLDGIEKADVEEARLGCAGDDDQADGAP